MEKLSLRPATHDDIRTIFVWRNDPWIVERGISRRAVSWEEHQAWFAKVIDSADIQIFLIQVGDSNAGQVRLQRLGNDAEISVYLVKDYTGRGHGVAAIRSGAERAFAAWPVGRIVARILQKNIESLSAFEKAGFVVSSVQPDANYTVMIRERSV